MPGQGQFTNRYVVALRKSCIIKWKCNLANDACNTRLESRLSPQVIPKKNRLTSCKNSPDSKSCWNITQLGEEKSPTSRNLIYVDNHLSRHSITHTQKLPRQLPMNEFALFAYSNISFFLFFFFNENVLSWKNGCYSESN